MKHEYYEILNLIGYGLAKYNTSFVLEFGFSSKNHFFNHLVDIGIVKTTGVVKNRQDLFDPFFENERRGWWQKGNTYIHRKHYIDSLLGDLNSHDFATVVKLYLQGIESKQLVQDNIQPVLKSKFRKLQETGLEAESFFIGNYAQTSLLADGSLTDARLLGDGYDFQVEVKPIYYLVEVKGVKSTVGSLRLTANEFEKAKLYQTEYILAVVTNLIDLPKLTLIQDPIGVLQFNSREQTTTQTYYHTPSLTW